MPSRCGRPGGRHLARQAFSGHPPLRPLFAPPETSQLATQADLEAELRPSLVQPAPHKRMEALKVWAGGLLRAADSAADLKAHQLAGPTPTAVGESEYLDCASAAAKAAAALEAGGAALPLARHADSVLDLTRQGSTPRAPLPALAEDQVCEPIWGLQERGVAGFSFLSARLLLPSRWLPSLLVARAQREFPKQLGKAQQLSALYAAFSRRSTTSTQPLPLRRRPASWPRARRRAWRPSTLTLSASWTRTT